jgi:tetratricopeptide (TPR) repeat protein
MDRANDPGTFLRTLTRAEDATAAEDWDDAAALWARVVEATPVEGRFWSRLGDARHRLGDHAGAIDAFYHAFDLRHGFPAETAAEIAGCHAVLGHTDEALDWLERAWDLGYRHVDRAREDDDLAALRDHPRFRELVGPPDTTGMSREDGWRLDLRYLAAEIRRRAYAPFRATPETEFDAAFAALSAEIGDLSDTQIILRIERILRMLNDAHARARPPKDRDDLQRAAPIQLYRFEEGLYITAASPAHADLPGARIVRFGEHSADDVWATLDPMMVRDNENPQWVKETITPRLRQPRILHALGLIPDPDRLPLTVETPDGEERTVELAADAEEPAWKLRDAKPAPDGWRFYPETLPAPLPLYLRNARSAYWFQHLAGTRAIYVQMNRVRDAAGESMAAFAERLFAFVDAHPVEKLVLDLRWNDGGNTFLARRLLHRIVGSPLNRRGSLFVVIGRRTFSAAQNMTSFLDFHTEAIFVGEPTGSSPSFIGETSYWTLPYSQVEVNVSDLHWVGTWPGDYRTWIAPELYTPPTFAAYRANRDPALEAILALDEHLPGW